jgi:hypothetical protein
MKDGSRPACACGQTGGVGDFSARGCCCGIEFLRLCNVTEPGSRFATAVAPSSSEGRQRDEHGGERQLGRGGGAGCRWRQGRQPCAALAGKIDGMLRCLRRRIHKSTSARHERRASKIGQRGEPRRVEVQGRSARRDDIRSLGSRHGAESAHHQGHPSRKPRRTQGFRHFRVRLTT